VNSHYHRRQDKRKRQAKLRLGVQTVYAVRQTSKVADEMIGRRDSENDILIVV